MDKLLERKNICLFQHNNFKMKNICSYVAYLLMSSRRFASQSIIYIQGLYLYFS